MSRREEDATVRRSGGGDLLHQHDAGHVEGMAGRVRQLRVDGRLHQHLPLLVLGPLLEHHNVGGHVVLESLQLFAENPMRNMGGVVVAGCAPTSVLHRGVIDRLHCALLRQAQIDFVFATTIAETMVLGVHLGRVQRAVAAHVGRKWCARAILTNPGLVHGARNAREQVILEQVGELGALEVAAFDVEMFGYDRPATRPGGHSIRVQWTRNGRGHQQDNGEEEGVHGVGCLVGWCVFVLVLVVVVDAHCDLCPCLIYTSDY